MSARNATQNYNLDFVFDRGSWIVQMLIWNVDEEACQGVVARQEFLDTLPQSQLTEGVVRKYHIRKFVHHPATTPEMMKSLQMVFHICHASIRAFCDAHQTNSKD